MYKFVRDDNGKVIEVGFEKMMEQDAAGYITLKDGVRAKRVLDIEQKKKVYEHQNANHTPPVSDAMGFTEHQLAEMEMDRQANGFSGVEFKPDPECPEFYQVHFSSHKERDKYIRHRGLVDKNRTKAVAITEADLEYAKQLMREKF